MRKSPTYSPEFIERGVRMVFESASQHSSQSAANESIAAKLGCTAKTLHR